MLADRVGLTGALSDAVVRRDRWPVHDRGRVLVDVAVMIADGGEAIGDIDMLRHLDALFGAVASPATCWRALDEIDPARLLPSWPHIRSRTVEPAGTPEFHGSAAA